MPAFSLCGYHSPAMSKFFLLILFGVLLYLVLNRAKRAPQEKRDAVPSAAETMIECAYCGLHVPQGESVIAGNQRYCCEEHRRLGQA